MTRFLSPLSKLFAKIFPLVKIRKHFAITIGLMLSTILYIYSPQILNQTCIKASERILIRLPKTFETCSIAFKSDIYIISYEFILYGDEDKKQRYMKTVYVEEKRNSLIVSNSLSKSELINQPHIMVNVSHESHVPVEISQVKINGEKVPLKRFFNENLLVKNKTYVDREYVRKFISLVLLKYNDSISNYLLTFFCLSLVPLIWQLVVSSFRVYSYSDQRLKTYFEKKYSTSHQSKREINICFGEDLERNDRWFRFLQLLGPAFGFVLTVSSLIAALHPALQAIRDIDKFFQAIQIAMVSTFVGLLIRIIAIFLQRINHKIFLRADDLFPYE